MSRSNGPMLRPRSKPIPSPRYKLSNADDKTIHETYLWPFYDGVKNSVGAIIIWSTETMEALLSNGTISQARLDDMAIRNVIAYYHVNLGNGMQPASQDTDAYVVVGANHSKIVRENEAKSLVLLKNTGGLPLKKPHITGIVRTHAGPSHLGTGTGSRQASLPYLIDPHMALTNGAVQDDRVELYNSDQDAIVNTHENITAVQYGLILSQESSKLIVNVLYGDINSSSRLTCMIIKNESDHNVDLCYTAQCNFTEGIYLDYRYFDAQNITVHYPFDHGLSYTTFSYTNLTTHIPSTISRYPTGKPSVGGPADPWDTVATVSARITNNGTLRCRTEQPVWQLRRFERVELETGKGEIVEFELWRGDILDSVFVGAGSRDLRLRGSFTI
ncbi:hypothetical protein BJX70DRAFT_388888 [Aspergillus crustosus]